MLAKYYPGGFIGTPLGLSALVAWLDEHMACSGRFGEADMGGDPPFELVAESSIETRAEWDALKIGKA